MFGPRLFTVVALAIAAHQNEVHIDNPLVATVLEVIVIVMVNAALAALAPEVKPLQSPSTHAAGVATLTAFAASYAAMAAHWLWDGALDLMRSWYLSCALLIGTLAAAVSACHLVEVWPAARCVHASHGVLYLFCFVHAMSSRGTGTAPVTLPPGDSPAEHAPVYILLHVALATGLTPTVRMGMHNMCARTSLLPQPEGSVVPLTATRALPPTEQSPKPPPERLSEKPRSRAERPICCPLTEHHLAQHSAAEANQMCPHITSASNSPRLVELEPEIAEIAYPGSLASDATAYAWPFSSLAVRITSQAAASSRPTSGLAACEA